MGIYEELKKMGYCFEYQHRRGKDRIEVWTNEEAEMAVRIEWMKIEEVKP